MVINEEEYESEMIKKKLKKYEVKNMLLFFLV